ncbi:hypothetical protein [Heyndrickxia camelliae]|uniref:Co-chaperone DjlA N-terminal domain-containing protein n=1 Tax=Heyndrickxia camelliae TaxID=1707093 RepID=A0A2N3LHR6_9BACI|nr:hypothetical protein [Heyndrickxia camelliae]PKR84109.1 hypothetical protein CWO92_14980 [Heyndrickxia camelliae]
MFLSELKQEEKTAFLELASLIAKIDHKQTIYEDSILNKYKKEMEIDHYKIQGLEMEDILKVFKSERSKNIVLAEILTLIFSDGVFHESERESLQLIKKHFGFKPSEFSSYKDWIDKIRELSSHEEYQTIG